jgi:soluble lytic murein transglycosylase-like protein
MIEHDFHGSIRWLERAAAERVTFYGLLAARRLGLGAEFGDDDDRLAASDIDAVAALPGGWRAFALLQVGQANRAEAELRQLWAGGTDNHGLTRALMLVARKAGLLELSTELAENLYDASDRGVSPPQVSIPSLRPRSGFSIDPALVYALAKLESNFDPDAVSPLGARGLMQVMPLTASYLFDDKSLATGDVRRLHDSGFNLDVGQRYVRHLAGLGSTNGELIRVLAAYNDGPGNVARWSETIRDRGDPLLFIEAIPNPETRRFVHHVLAYSWIYAAHLRLATPSLDMLAAGISPRVDWLDGGRPGADMARTLQ